MKKICVVLVALALPLQGCVAMTAASIAGDVVEGTAKTAAFGVKTTGRAAGAVLPGGGDDDKDD